MLKVARLAEDRRPQEHTLVVLARSNQAIAPLVNWRTESSPCGAQKRNGAATCATPFPGVFSVRAENPYGVFGIAVKLFGNATMWRPRPS